MKRLAYCGIAILFILAGHTSPASAQRAANPLINLGFNKCAGKPCFLGILPGKTSWEDTVAILLKHDFKPSADASDLFYERFEPNNPFQIGVYVIRVPDNPSVPQSITLTDRQNKFGVTVADVLALYGLPCKVESDYPTSVWFSYPDMLVHTWHENETAYTWKEHIDDLHLLDPQLPISVDGMTVCNTLEDSTEYRLWFTF